MSYVEIRYTNFGFYPLCYEQTSPLVRHNSRLYHIFVANVDVVALLLLFPLKSCDFRGPRKADYAFWGEGKAMH